MLKRLFDLVTSCFVLVLLFPVFVFTGILILLDSRGGVFFLQQRVGFREKEFRIIKFRTMKSVSANGSLLTLGVGDPRITGMGKILRRLKVDEFPQLINVIKGDMSLVGPRPEVSKYVVLYNEEQKKVLEVRPGITDPASIIYFNEGDELERSDDAEKHYVDHVMPDKLRINLEYLQRRTFLSDLGVLFRTLFKMI